MEEEIYKLYLRYSWLNISIKDIYNMMLEIDKSSNIISELESRLNDMIRKLLNDNKRSFYLINNYINNMFVKTDDYKKSYNNINMLLAFFDRYDFSFNPELIIKLLSKNGIINNSLSVIVKNNKGNLNNIVNGGILGLMVEIYCSLNNVTIVDTKKEMDNSCGLTTSYRMYMNEIKKYPLLGYDETDELFRQYNAGDISAKNKLIESNLRLVPFVARNYIDDGVPLLDLIQEGNIGLISAIEKFDVSKGFKFSTYAKWWIRQAIVRYIVNNGRVIRLPSYLQEKNMKFIKTIVALRNELGREPTDDEIASEMNVKVSWVNYMQSIFKNTLSIEKIALVDDDKKNSDYLKLDYDLEEEVMQDDLVDRVSELMDKSNLTEEEKELLRYRFGLNGYKIKSLTDLAKGWGITREAARQREARALIKIKNSSYIKEFALYMDNPGYYFDEKGNFDRRKLVDKPSADRVEKLMIKSKKSK